MKEFFNIVFANWWGILLFCMFAIALWLLLSAVFYRAFFKRFYDIVLSLLALIVLSPILLFLTVLGAIKMKGNPFFTQLRPGKINKKTGQERIFKLIKFRTMTCEKDENGELLPDEKRLTKYGSFLRNSSLDELPELWNVLIGDMSFVGPRPDVPGYADILEGNDRRVLELKPGITGPASLKYRNEEEILAMQDDPIKYNDEVIFPDKVKINLRYLDNWSFFEDIKIIIYTVLSKDYD